MGIDQSPRTAGREVWRRADGWVSRSVNSRVFVGARYGHELTLEGAAAVVWIGLEEPATRDELVQLISEALPGVGVTRGTVDDAIRVLLEHALVTSDEPWRPPTTNG